MLTQKRKTWWVEKRRCRWRSSSLLSHPLAYSSSKDVCEDGSLRHPDSSSKSSASSSFGRCLLLFASSNPSCTTIAWQFQCRRDSHKRNHRCTDSTDTPDKRRGEAATKRLQRTTVLVMRTWTSNAALEYLEHDMTEALCALPGLSHTQTHTNFCQHAGQKKNNNNDISIGCMSKRST